MFNRNKGLVDKVKNRRVGLLFVNQGSYRTTSIGHENSFDVILEVEEIFNDKIFSKISVISVAYNNSSKSSYYIRKNINPWIKSEKIHWLSPMAQIDRDNKLNDLLNNNSGA